MPSIFWHLTENLAVSRVTLGDAFQALHARLKAAGQLDHDWDSVEEAKLRQVKVLWGLSSKIHR